MKPIRCPGPGRRRLVVALSACLLLPGAALAQGQAQDSLADLLARPGTDLRDEASRKAVVDAVAAAHARRLADARQRATALGLPLRVKRPNGTTQEIADFDGNRPLYHTTHNANAAISTGANLVRSTYSVDGTGVVIGLWDGGSARVTHQEFGGRVVSKDGASSIDHATHVAGTLSASGVVAAAKGMAPAVSVDSYDWNSDTSEMTSRGASAAGQAGKIYLSNHSYGFISGWNYVADGIRTWEWNGNGTTAAGIEQDFGRYNTYARDQDALAASAPYYLIFRSAGNERVDNPAQGEAVSLSVGGAVVAYDSALHPPGDGTYRGGFENISYEALSKNVMTVGSVTDAVTGSTRDITKANLSSFTSWGPTDDGRIKPDVVANGEALYSSLNASDTSYGTYSGTSMATPNATGSAALLIQYYGVEFPGQAMRAATLKGLLIHTADDRGNPGPDYKFGWGLVNAKAAADLIQDQHDNPLKQRITESSLSTSTVTRTLPVIWDGVSPLVATLSWTDPAGTATTTSDSRTARLVNNLNLKITAPGGSDYLPYVMPFVGNWSQASMDTAATTGINNTDNVEQVRIASPPAAGVYQVVVSFSGTLTNSLQNYSLLISGTAAQEPPLSLSGVTPASGLPGTVIMDVSGTSIHSDATLKLSRAGQSDIVATSLQLNGGVLRGQFNLTGAAPGQWNVTVANPGGGSATLANAFTLNPALWSESFDGSVSGWTSQATTGTNAWVLTTAASHSPLTSYFGPGPDTKTTCNLTSPAVNVPANATSLQLRFWHNYNLQSTQDGGRLEFSLDGGAWFDVTASGSGASFAANGYNVTMSTSGALSNRSEFMGLAAWSGNSGGFIETVVNLTDTAKYAGHALSMRWRLATNVGTASAGWYVDTIGLMGTIPANQAPQITSPATAATAETVTDPDTTVFRIVRGSLVGLSVGASDDAGEPALTYTWSLLSGPPGVVYSANGNNAAKSTTATFPAIGDYRFSVQVADAGALTASSTVNVRVLPTPAQLTVAPPSATVVVGGTQSYTPTARDQFAAIMSSSGTTWSVNGGGSINASGLFSATTAGGPFTVTASLAAVSANASVTVTPAPATITLSNLNHTYDGTPRPASATTNPPGLAVTLTYNGLTQAPVGAGNYSVQASIANPNYTGSASGTLQVAKAAAGISFVNLTQTYDGTPRVVSATTSPPGLTVNLTYDSAAQAPVNAGDYAVAAGISDLNYQGSASNTLHVLKKGATFSFGNLSQTYDGTPRVVTVTTDPPGLSVSTTYDGLPAVPVNAGIYAIASTVVDPNYQGSSTEVLHVAKASATVTLGDLSQIYDGTPRPASVTTTPAGLSTSITYDGLAQVPVNAGAYSVEVSITDLNHQGTASDVLHVGKASATISLGDLAQTYDGTPRPVSAATTPSGLAVSITYDGSPDLPVNAGSYAVAASIADTNYQGTANETLQVGKATASISFGDLAQTYDGTPRVVSVTTTPPGLTVDLSYDTAPEPPVNAGTYTLAASIADTNYTGTASDVLHVAKAIATITLGDLEQTYDGTPQPVTVTTTPAGLETDVTYDGETEAPSEIGSHDVLASIDDPNYTGQTTGELEIVGISYEVWQSQHFSAEQILAGEADRDDDPDGDGLDNLGEYALGGDPWAYTAAPAMQLDDTHMTLVFTRPKGLPDVSYIAERTSDFTAWTAVTLEVIAETAESETVRARVARPTAGIDLYMRMRFEVP